MRTVKRILAAVDLGDTTEGTCAAAVDLARAFGAELLFVHVYDVSNFAELQREAPGVYLDQILENLRMQVLGKLGPLSDIPHRVEVIPNGSVAQTILDAVDRHKADLIVMGTHGRAGLQRMLLGSVAETVLRRTRVPVLVVPVRAAQPAPEEGGAQ